jgi:hypothetical protein
MEGNMRKSLLAVTLAVAATFAAPLESYAAAFSRPAGARDEQTLLVQYWRGPPRYGWGGRPYGWGGRPYWYARPWVRRPYYGTIVAGVALGTLITVAAVGAVPRRPAPDLCWYWADPYQRRGYWDYCD